VALIAGSGSSKPTCDQRSESSYERGSGAIVTPSRNSSPIGTIKTYLFRARNLLKERLLARTDKRGELSR